MKIRIIALLFLSLAGLLCAAPGGTSEDSQLVSYAQDLYRQQGVNLSRSSLSFENQDTWGRVFMIRLVSRNSTLSNDLLQAFLMGGAVTQHARSPIDQVVIVVEVEFGQHKEMIFRAEGKCCEKLYNNRMTPEMFTEVCLRMK